MPDETAARRRGGTRKIADALRPCAHPQHDPPQHMVYEAGVYEHVCPNCGAARVFKVGGWTL